MCNSLRAPLFPAIALLLVPAAGRADDLQLPHDYPIQPVPFTQVRVTDEFWQPRMETNRAVSIPYALGKCEENGRMENFKIAGGLIAGQHRGDFPFDDTDPYKIAEGAAYALMVHPDPDLDKYLDELIALIAAAQEDDGYLYTCRTNDAQRLKNWYGDRRWEKLQGSHELYNAGHMYEAAVAHFQATGKRSFLDVAIKNADLIDRVFGPQGNHTPPGHQIIEMGLARLYRATGDQRYLDLAKFFLDVRGHSHDGRRLWGAYNQDHLPVVQQAEAVGHAVRATYMYAGMADVAALTGDQQYVRAMHRLWENVVGKKLYLTGGVGATGHGEAFGANYELPNLTAYCETCAAIGNVYWNHRLFLLHGHGQYLDVLERTLYNGLISGVSLDGKLFFYPNPLESDGSHARSPWFGCACCPGNVTRFIASVPGYAYARRDDNLYVNLYLAGQADVEVAGQPVKITQQTRYPWDGQVRIAVQPEQAGTAFNLRLRIPGWAREQVVPSDLYRFASPDPQQPTLRVNGQAVPCEVTDGYATLRRDWQAGDAVELDLPMPVRRVLCHDRVEANRGRVALQRGPIVYCVEWPDVPRGQVLNLLLADDQPLASEFAPDLLSGVGVIRGRAVSTSWKTVDGKMQLAEQPVEFTAIPYYAWAHRGKGEMAVWLARDEQAVRPRAAPTIASTSRARASGGDPAAVNDQREPRTSGDHTHRFLHWWPRKGTTEWVQYEFPQSTQVSAVEVYWFDDTGRGECRLPVSWQLLYREGDAWRPVANPSGFGCEGDRYNRTTFDPVTTGALRIEVQLPERFSAGIHEWRVE